MNENNTGPLGPQAFNSIKNRHDSVNHCMGSGTLPEIIGCEHSLLCLSKKFRLKVYHEKK